MTTRPYDELNGDDEDEMLIEMEEEREAKFKGGPAGSSKRIRTSSIVVRGFDTGKEFLKTGLHKLRRPIPAIPQDSSDISFQLVEADYDTCKPIPSPGEIRRQRRPLIRLFGSTADQRSVLLYVDHVLPYFYVPAWEGFGQADVGFFGDALNASLKAQSSGRDSDLTKHVMEVNVVYKKSLWGYQFGQNKPFIKVTTAVPQMVATARRILEQGLSVQGTLRFFQTYESNIPFVLRWMIDADVKGGSWLSIAAGKFKMREKKTSYCDLELDCSYKDLIAHPIDGEWGKIAPLRILSFDIECAGRKGHFPTPDQDSVIQIASVVSVQAQQNTILVKAVHTLNTCAAIPGALVLPYKTEEELLSSWMQFVRASDPDLLTGYNIQNFDFPYLIDRAKKLGVKDFPFLGRLREIPTTVKNTTFSSKAHGTRENKETIIHGRVVFDVIQAIRRDYKLRSYSLNAVSAEFLNQQKEDVHHSIISDLQLGTDETRRRLASYCLKDALLPLRLLDKLMMVINYVEMARVTGVPISFLLTRGQQIKVVSQLYRKANEQGYLVPVRDRHVANDEKFEGATVIEPMRGYYTEPVATLDFASLYPSIMMAHNLCYTTLISPKDVERLKPDQYTKTPTGDSFTKSDVHKGLLPLILEELLGARKNAKRLMKEEKDPFKKAVLDGRQLALKISANSVYGFTGAQVGQLPCLPISKSVTSFGREMIEQTKQCVEKKYRIENGYAHDAVVIYGDTDSVMVKFGVATVAEAMTLGKEAAEAITQEFIKPIKLEFEKVYWPYLLMNKKRYAGLYWTNAAKWDKIDTKGIETVRRDNCALVKDVVETCLRRVLVDQSVESALSYAKMMISDLLLNKVDISLLTISKSMAKDGADYDNKQAHVVLAEKMRKRDPLTAPVIGDRVPYVVTQGVKGARAYEKAEDPIYVLENDIPIDTTYYVENQLRNPLTRIFEPILGAGNVNSLFTGAHTLKVLKKSSASGAGIMKFAVVKRTCLGCKVVLKPLEKTVCHHCQGKRAELYLKEIARVREHEQLFSRVWTQCQRCAGTLHTDVLCSSRDCPIFYRRKKVQKDLRDAQKALNLFEF
eukprot:gb/GEZN01000731.1/.p1 GENE.gb/GEZN01000731.1/~~gb/GEZN01000731.1/.p1  ORF type:complete len:1083 (+),score=192.41 gb/GEZN01000731.1/:81-3329(+)